MKKSKKINAIRKKKKKNKRAVNKRRKRKRMKMLFSQELLKGKFSRRPDSSKSESEISVLSQAF